jgi:hypothetical protein
MSFPYLAKRIFGRAYSTFSRDGAEQIDEQQDSMEREHKYIFGEALHTENISIWVYTENGSVIDQSSSYEMSLEFHMPIYTLIFIHVIFKNL